MQWSSNIFFFFAESLQSFELVPYLAEYQADVPWTISMTEGYCRLIYLGGPLDQNNK